MRQQHIAKISLAGVMLATPACAAEPDWVEYLDVSVSAASAALSAGYRAAPALMLGLVALIAVPLTAVAGGLARWWRRRQFKLSQDVGNSANPQLPIGAMHASLEVVGDAAGKSGNRIDIIQDMVRIGREDDNDIRIRSKRVHCYHAAIHREDFGIYRITDLAGGEDNGLSVNGEPCEEAELKDGDVIELGPGRLRFHAGLV